MKKDKSMFYNLFILPVLSIMTFFQCTTPKVLPENYIGKKIEYGSGGGFTGGTTTYTLLDNGDLFLEKSMNDTMEFVIRLDENITNQLFENYNTLKINEININNPGNIYKFLRYHKSGETHSLVWEGKSEYNNLNLFYNNLRAVSEPKKQK